MTDKTILSFGAALRAGMVDSLHPGALTGLLLFAVFLFFCARINRRIALPGITFIAGAYIATMPLAVGTIDAFILTKGFDIFLDISYFVIAVAFLVIGGIFLRDWWRGKRDHGYQRVIIRWPWGQELIGPEAGSVPSADSKSAARPTRKGRLALCGLALLSAAFVAFIETAWAPDMYVFSIVGHMLVPGKTLMAVLSLLIYGFAYVLPLIILLYVVSLSLVQESIAKAFSVFQVIMAAIFLGYGATFIFRYYL